MFLKTMLREDPKLQPIRYKGGSGLTIGALREMVEKACIEHGLNVIVAVDTVSSGRLFDRSTWECVSIKNVEHPTDYYEEVIMMRTQGIYAFFDFYYTGTSKNGKRIAEGEREHSTITGSIIGAIKKATVSNEARESELCYYSMLCDAIESVFA